MAKKKKLTKKERKEILKDIIKIHPEQPMMKKARRIANSLYRAYIEEEKDGRECGHLLREWVEEIFWGRMVEDHLPIFDETWKMLHEGKYTQKNPFSYGDADHSLWVEYPKEPIIKPSFSHVHSHEDIRVIVAVCHCACIEDNTYLFIETGREFAQTHKSFLSYSFRVATVWPREKRSITGIKWGDDREIGLPSLNTYKKRAFHYGYFDCRDEGHVLLYENFLKSRVENENRS